MSEKEIVDAGGVVTSQGGTIMSRETYARSIGIVNGKPVSVGARFDQGEWWLQKSGAWIRVADMSPGHRYNTAAMLMRTARVHAFRYAWDFAGQVSAHDGGDMAHAALERLLDDLNEQSATNPRKWLRSTTLYRALTAGLAVRGDGTEPWQKTGLDPVAGEAREVAPYVHLAPVCEIPAYGCSGEAHA